MSSLDSRWTPPAGAAVEASDAKYAAYLAERAGEAVVTLHGTISTPQPSVVLNPFIDAVHGRVVSAGRSAVTVDLSDLEFCNSSGFKALIRWVDLVLAMPDAAQYRIQFRANPARKWQRTSLLALTCFAPSRVELL